MKKVSSVDDALFMRQSLKIILEDNDYEVVVPPQITNGNQNNYIKAIGMVRGDVKLILDCVRLLNEDQIENITHKSTGGNTNEMVL